MTKKQIVQLSLFGFLAVFIGIVSTIPAKWLMSKVVGVMPNVYMQGVSGTIWRGKAEQFAIDALGAPQYFGQMQWKLKPLSLVMGKVALDVKTQGAPQGLEGTASVSFGKTATLKDLQFYLPADKVKEFIPLPAKLGGRIEGTFKTVKAKMGDTGPQLVDVDGGITWQQASADLGSGDEALGTYLAEVSKPDEDKIHTEISSLDVKGLELSGQAAYGFVDQSPMVEMVLAPKKTLKPRTLNMLKQAGTAKPDGRILVKFGKSQ